MDVEVERERKEVEKEGRVVWVPIYMYLQDLISFLQHSMLSHWTLGMHILNHVVDAPCREQNRPTVIKLPKVRGYDQTEQTGYDIQHHWTSWEKVHPQ